MKKVISSLLIVIMVFSLVACGKDNNGGTVNNETSSKEESVDTESSKENGNNVSGGFVVGFSNGYWGNTWRAQMVEDFETRAKEYKEEGIISDYMIANTESDPTEQLNQINSMIDSGVDAILIDAVSPTTIKQSVEKAQEKGILVVIANDPAYYEGTICVAGDNYAWQQILAKWFVEQLDGKGDIVEINGVAGNSASILREEANKDVLAEYPEINVLSSVPGNWSQTEAQSIMTTMLSSYENIDGILAQDVMGEGILKAYSNAGIEPPVMTGDYTKSFLNVWKENPDLNTIGVSYAPGNAVPALDVAIRLLQGKELNEDLLVANPMDPNQKNTIMVPPPYVVTRDAQPDAPWMEGLDNTKAISLDEAIELMADQPDTAALDGYPSQDFIDSFFKD